MNIDQLLHHFLECRSISTDSRFIEKGSIYFALKGERFNGNDFAEKAIQNGASLAVMDEDRGLPGNRVMLVEDVLKTLQHLSKTYRLRFKIPFLAITGSNGKTTSKELIREVLCKKFNHVSATKGNLNNHIGVPLTLLSIPENCDFAIIEMGANHCGEIKSYCDIAEPTHGFITNIGKAHLEGFGGVEGVFRGKKELFDYLKEHQGLAFVNGDFENIKLAAAGVQSEIFESKGGESTFEVLSSSPNLIFRYSDKSINRETQTHLAGAYNIYNIAAAISIGKYFGVNISEALDAVSNFKPDNNRSQITTTASNQVIMDAYNANPSSMFEASQNLAIQTSSTFFVIGDMFELGSDSEEEHRKILSLAESLGLNGIAIGKYFQSVSQKFTYPVFVNKEDAVLWLKQNKQESKTILLKGSRGMKLEELMPFL